VADAEPLIPLCPSEQLAERGAGFRFEVLAGGEALGAFAVRYRGRVVAFLNRCAHVAMDLDWVAGHFFDSDGETLLCATHGAAYDPASGRCLGGPCAGRGGLRPLQVVEQEGVVYWRPEPGLRPRAEGAGVGV
jgi:nitrite reductase/ring-hydroxylating ferredoxin subunit